MKTIVIFSGAGLSVESGIPTFRGTNGLWENHSIEEVATPLGWMQNPEKVLNFYAQAFYKMQQCEPNAGHFAIAQLSQQFKVYCLTQNIDTLLEKAGVQDVWHLHGRIDFNKCEWHYDIPPLYSDWQCHYKAQMSQPTQLGDLCPECGKQLRPDVVWFGEAVDLHIDQLYEIVDHVDIFIGVGTSATVYPAANLLRFFAGIPEKYFIDPEPNFDVLLGYQILVGTATEKLPELVNQLINNQT